MEESRLILKTRTGSHSYGTNVEGSDEDFKAVYIPSKDYLLGLKTVKPKQIQEDQDITYYPLRHFVKLILNNNPNILEVLFAAPRHIIFENEFGEDLRKLKYSILSKKVYESYGHYANSQVISANMVSKESEGKRFEIVEKYGYDTRAAMHAIRLLRMGWEILKFGEVNVHRSDASELLDIRNGKYSLQEIRDESKHLRRLLDLAYDKSKLPDVPNFNKINDWLVDMHERTLNWRP